MAEVTIPEHIQTTTRSEHVRLEIKRHLALDWINTNTYARATRWRTMGNINQRIRNRVPVLKFGSVT